MSSSGADLLPESPAQAGDSADESAEAGGDAPFPIVGLGASAGGLEAFTQFLKHLPSDTGMGFVLVQHLDPEHESALAQILARVTSLPVNEIAHDEPVLPDHVYVIPRDTDLSIERGILKLAPRERSRQPHRPIDAFFESLARGQRERAIGVVLSGTASDGTLGLEAIKAEGGITFAQDESAKYDSMPNSAVAAGCVDFVLSPRNIAGELARIARHPYVAPQAGAMPPAPDDQARETGRGEGRDDGIRRILLLLRNHSGVDFSLYKPSTLQRRIARRAVLGKQNTLEEYAAFLQGNARELDALYSDALISVTGFFRNPDAFDVLRESIFPELQRQRGDEPIRAWVLGCSSGEEAYSIAMTFAEAAREASRMRKLQLFATDANEALLDKARHGLYARSQVREIPPQRLRRFFVEEEGGYRVVKSLRETIVFARQNLISDPPFSRMDFISCRNLLIYLEPELQKKALPMFHYALRPKGCLFLGASETIGGFTDLFEPVDKKHRLYARKAGPTPAFHLPVRQQHREQGPAPRSPAGALAPEREDADFRGERDAQREADRVTVNQFAPAGVLIDAELRILQFRGQTGAYLEPPAGKASFDVLKMAREGLARPLRAAIEKAKKENSAARTENVRVARNGSVQAVNVEVIPLKNLKERCFLILFEDARRARRAAAGAPSRVPARGAKASRAAGGKAESRRIAELEAELAGTRDYLQSLQEQHEAANEELQASNEEVQSANEELQSINEELETSKEELESANEELTTVNDEMARQNAELNRLNSDLVNLQNSSRLAIVLLGRDRTIRRYSPRAEKLFGLLSSDLGRPIGSVRNSLLLAESGPHAAPSSAPDLESLVAEVIASVRASEHEVRDKDGRWYALRVHPYVTLDNNVDGAVLVLFDLDKLKRASREAEAARDFAQAILRTARDPLLVLRADLHINSANEAFYRTFKVSPAESLGRLIFDLGDGQWNVPALRELLEDILPRNSFFDDLEITHDFPGIGQRTMLLNARQLEQQDGAPPSIVLAIEDVTERQRADAVARELTERKRTEEQSRQDAASLTESDRRKNEFLAILAHELRNPLAPIRNALEILQLTGSKNEAVASATAMMRRQVGQMVRLVDDLLDVSRISRGTIELRKGRIELAAVVNHALEASRSQVQGMKQDLTVTLPPEPVYLNADRARLAQVVSNLLNNASKFTDRGGRISLSAAQEGRQAVLRVSDSGIGIAAGELPRIFDLFVQVDTSLERSTGGLGIGLTLVKSLVEAHGGTIEARSGGAGQGSEFVLRLPIAAETSPLPPPEPAASEPVIAAPRRILVVDDNRDAGTSLAMLLELSGHDTFTAFDGDEAVEAAARVRPDLVLLDIGLPKMNGFEVARKIREQPWGKAMMLVALTGWGQEEDRRKSSEAGFDAHLVKPAELAALIKLLASAPPREKK